MTSERQGKKSTWNCSSGATVYRQISVRSIGALERVMNCSHVFPGTYGSANAQNRLVDVSNPQIMRVAHEANLVPTGESECGFPATRRRNSVPAWDICVAAGLTGLENHLRRHRFGLMSQCVFSRATVHNML
jgi:hypothetical protein